MSQTANDAPLLPAPSLAGTDVPAPPSADPEPVAAPIAPPPLSLDGEMPRLGSGAFVAPTPAETPRVAIGDDAELPSLPSLSSAAAPPAPPHTPTPDGLDLPSLPSAAAAAPPAPPQPEVAATPTTPDGRLDLPSLPSLPTAAPASAEPTGAPAHDAAHDRRPPAADGDTESPDASTPEHPMAHLMGAKKSPSEASRKAAEIRAAKKAKARKIKIGVAIGAIVFAVAVGPPLFRWLSNALDEAGDTSTEQPAD